MITASPPGFERRLFERFVIRFPTKFKYSRDDYGTNVFLHEASASGLRLTTKDRLFVNDVIVLEIEVPDQAPPLVLKAEVVWVKSIEPYGWESGLRFPKLNLMRLGRLYKFVSDH